MKGNTAYACNIHKQVKLQIFTACVFDRGGWVWLDEPHCSCAAYSDIAGGQRRMEPERGDSDK